MRIKYKKPPINELIIGCYFDPPLFQLQAERVGLFWSKIRDEFPTILQQPELAIPVIGQALQLNFEPYPMPRFWLVAHDDVMLLQIQKNAFLLNWRKRDKEYPHFDQVKAQFDRYLSLFKSFLASELGMANLPVRMAELTYTNLVPPEEGWWGLGDIRSVLPDVTVPEMAANQIAEPDINYVTAYRFAPDLSMNLTVRTARHNMDISKTALIFEFRTIGVVENWEAVDEWYRRAHDVINDSFTTVTAKDIRQNSWQPE